MKKSLVLIFTIVLSATAAFAQKANTYAAVVSFNSMCCGVPDNAPLMKMISSFKKQNKIKKIAVDSIGPMGREGEYYMAFRLKELTKSQKVKFIQQLKKTVLIMTDKGSADVKEALTIDKAELSSRAGITVLNL